MESITIEKAEIIKVQDGDVVAVFVKGYQPSDEEKERIRTYLEKSFLPKIVKVHVFNSALVEIKVLRAE